MRPPTPIFRVQLVQGLVGHAGKVPCTCTVGTNSALNYARALHFLRRISGQTTYQYEERIQPAIQQPLLCFCGVYIDALIQQVGFVHDSWNCKSGIPVGTVTSTLLEEHWM